MPDQVDWRALEREASPGRAVGRLLRDQREARSLGLSDIEKSLRIRRPYLEAIEEGRFDKLPGAAYIPAFLRAYAAHVGLDPEKVMTAYHLSGPVPIKRPVALPADFPIVEKRAPIGLAVLTVLLVVSAGYAAWHYLPREQSVVAEKVPPVPDRLLASHPAVPSSSEPATPATTAGVPATIAAPSQPTQGTLPPEVWPASRRDPGVAQSPAVQPQPALLAPPVVIAVPTPPPVIPAPAVEEAVARPPAADAASLPVRFDTPISVRANSWIELRAPNGDVLAQTYVRAGESYVVPAGIAYRIIAAR
jgi:cytoskeleton protein RodZ